LLIYLPTSFTGVIKYIGKVEFAEGIWLGLDMRGPKGNHDGSVDGRRYFHCKKNYGVFVRPGAVTVRGISGAKLVKDETNHFRDFERLSTRL
jgi:CAP-Gly domain-containing linker protein 3/4